MFIQELSTTRQPQFTAYEDQAFGTADSERPQFEKQL
jgi:hypothetical protein